MDGRASQYLAGGGRRRVQDVKGQRTDNDQVRCDSLDDGFSWQCLTNGYSTYVL